MALPGASACAVSGSVSGPVSDPSWSGLGFRPRMSSFTVYTNNSIYKGKNTWGWREKGLEDEAESLTGIQDTLHLNMYIFTCKTLASKQTLATRCMQGPFYIQILQIKIKVVPIYSEWVNDFSLWLAFGTLVRFLRLLMCCPTYII